MAEFDRYAGSYEDLLNKASGFIGKGAEFFTWVKARKLIQIGHELGVGESARVLDVGCGVGLTDSMLAPRWKALEGVDVSGASIDQAKSRNPSVSYSVYDGMRLPYADSSFDLVFTINVLHHVPPSGRASFLAEMSRVTKPGGWVAVFEHNPANPLTRKSVRDCPFDEGVELVAPSKLKALLEQSGLTIVRSDSILFFPFEGEAFRKFEDRLGWLPLGAQYFALARRGEG